MTNKPPRPITAEDLERLTEPLKSSLWPLKYASPTGRLPRPWPEIWRDKPDIAAGPQKPTFLGADFGEAEARAVAAIYAGTLTEVAPIPKSAWDNVNPNPYYSYLCSAMTLTAVYKAHRACEAVPSFDASYFAAHEWRNLSYATDRGIVFG